MILWLAACAEPPVRPAAASGCPEGSVADGDTCVAEACGTGPWGHLSGTEPAVYVQAGATGGTGTPEAPFGTIAEAVAAAAGVPVVVAAGLYEGQLPVSTSARILGRCPDLVELDAARSRTAVWIDAAGATVELSGITVRGAAGAGIRVTAGTVSLVDVTATDNDGVGIEIGGPSTVTITGGSVSDNRNAGLVVDGDTTVSVDGTTLARNSMPESDALGGEGVLVWAGEVTLTSATIEGNEEFGVLAYGAEADVTLIDATVRGTVSDVDGIRGIGVSAQEGARLVAVRTAIEENTSAGVFAYAGEIELTDCTITDTLPIEGRWGRGIEVYDDGHVTVTGGEIARNHDLGAGALAVGALLELDGVTVADTRARALDGGFARGVLAQDGGEVHLTSTVVERTAGTGVSVLGPGSTAVLTDTDISTAWSDPDGEGGGGITVQQFAAATLTRVGVSDAQGMGVWAVGAGSIIATTLAVSGVRRPGESAYAQGVCAQEDGDIVATDVTVTGTEGPGLSAVSGGTLDCERCTATGNGFAGVLAAGGSVDLTVVTLSDNVEDPALGGGLGIYATDDFGPSALNVAGGEVGPHRVAGVWLARTRRAAIRGATLAGGEGYLDTGYGALGGYGIFVDGDAGAWDETNGSGLLLESTTVSGSASVGVFLSGSTATVTGATWSDNALDVVQQSCVDGVVPLSGEELGTENTRLCLDSALLTDPVSFDGLLLPSEDAAE